ncbi:MAG TPA: type III secretion system chaperone [Magnetospirillum sp.]|nr:type III secretion system chaperone [Magnetospirillum sp.]
MSVSDLLAEFGRKAGLGSLGLDGQGVCRLSFDGSLIVDLEFDDGAGVLHLYGTVGPVPAGDREAVYQRLLSANLFGRETGGATLALDGGRDEIVLCRALVPDHLDPLAFEAALAAFVDALEGQREQLKTAPVGGPSHEPPARFGMGPMMRA